MSDTEMKPDSASSQEEELYEEDQETMRTIDTEDFTFSDNIVLDLHDLAGILLYEYRQMDQVFRHSKLLEVANVQSFPQCLPVDKLLGWFKMSGYKSGYFVVEPQDTPPEDTPPVGPENFLHPNLRCPKDLDIEEVELIYWRVKLTYDVGDLIYSLQLVLDSLPASTKLRVRTSKGRSLTCPARSFTIEMHTIIPHESLYVGQLQPYNDETFITPRRRAHLKEHFIADGSVAWVSMIIRDDAKEKFNVTLDLSSAILGLRGPGGEIFIMEDVETYEGMMCYGSRPDDFNPEHYIPRMDKHDPKRDFETMGYAADYDVELATRVLRRLEKVCSKEETYCAYCGKSKPASRCSKCACARYCNSACQKKSWKYHKVWCKADAVARDIEMESSSETVGCIQKT